MSTKTSTKDTARECACGCGIAITTSATYKPGHDAKHVSVTLAYIAAGNLTPAQGLAIFADSRPALHNKLARALRNAGYTYDAKAKTWARAEEVQTV